MAPDYRLWFAERRGGGSIARRSSGCCNGTTRWTSRIASMRSKPPIVSSPLACTKTTTSRASSIFPEGFHSDLHRRRDRPHYFAGVCSAPQPAGLAYLPWAGADVDQHKPSRGSADDLSRYGKLSRSTESARMWVSVLR